MLRLLSCKPSPHLPYSTTTASTKPHLQYPPLVTDPTLTLYFLQKSCNLSPSAAASIAEKINLKSTKNAHSVLALLRDYGFSDSHITRLISYRPRLLLSCPTRTLRPKLDFYTSLSLSKLDVADQFCARPRIFFSSLKDRQAPNLHLLRLLLPSEADLLAAVRRFPEIILYDLHKIIPINTKPLLDYGIPVKNILMLIALHPKCMSKCPNEFASAIAAVEEMGVKLSMSAFVHAFAIISKVPKAVWESRVQNFISLGWSKDEVISAFAKHPYCMSSSMEKVKRNVKFFEEELGWGAAKLSTSPVLVSFSLEKRIAPRYRFLKLLSERGLLNNGITCSHFIFGENRFRKLYVDKYQEILPHILETTSGDLVNLSVEMDKK